MSINRSILYTILFLCGVLHWHIAKAQPKEAFSYIYIQGDKETPFYVKFEDEMLPRYGKNYSIISELAPGPVNIQILFQQNKYPAQKFVIQAPENGFRGFLLMRKGDVFSLYDIHQQFYLQAGNKASDDHLPSEPAQSITQPVTNTPAKTEEPVKPMPVKKAEEQPKPKPEAKPKPIEEKPKKEAVKETPAVTIPTPPKPPVTTPPPVSKPVAQPAATKETKDGKEPAFLDNISLENNKTTPSGTITKPSRNRMTVTNSDCPEAISDEDFSDIEARLNDKFGEDKVKFLFGKMDKCYTTAQVRTLARKMDTDAERYTLLKRIYARVTDQSLYPTLEREFTEPEWKNYFHSFLNK